MRRTTIVGASFIVAALLTAAPLVSAQTPDNAQALRREIEQIRKDFDALQQQYGDRLSALEAKLAAIEGNQAGERSPTAAVVPVPPAATPEGTPPTAVPVPATAQAPPGAEGAGGPTGSLPAYGGAAAGSKVFNPDVAVIGNAVGAAGVNRVEAAPAIELREAEVSLQAVVDPYARADFFIAVGPEGASLEEGFLTFPALPGGVLMKVGKFKAAFGKVNALHPHVLPWVDRPLAMSLLGGEDGINDGGLSVARLIPNRWLFLEATGQVFQGNSGVFSSSERRDLSYIGHLRGYQDITESSNIDLGFSYATGRNASGIVSGTNTGRLTTDLFGVDATVRWRPLRRSIYHSFVGRTELVWSRRDQPSGLQSGMGCYVSGDYQIGRRWFAGLRYDRSNHADDASLLDTGQSVMLTYWPSEFSQVRGQYRRTAYAIGPTANEFLFQFQFSIGAHGAHPF